jgi:tetratricopeptide (TPR) repeat protein
MTFVIDSLPRIVASQVAHIRCFMAAGLLLACLTVAQAQTSRAVSAVSYLERGAEWAARGDLDRAITDFNLALAFDPRLAAAYNHRGVARQAKGDMEEALADFNLAIEIDPRHAAVWSNRSNRRFQPRNTH